MSVIARWHVTAIFGFKADLITALEVWINSVAKRAGAGAKNLRLLTGSIGTKESELQMEVQFTNIAEVDAFFHKIAEQGPLHGKW
jgi:hypothetical protein